MRAVDVITQKRDGRTLSKQEIDFIVGEYARGAIPDYQMAAFLMTVYFRGMTLEETIDLTRAMIDSGETVSFPGISRFKVDKHSTGGVGDKTTLVLAPLLASFGLAVPKLSGRGLGHTGGTLDKLESIPGFRTGISIAEFQQIADEVGVAVASATLDLVPADQKIYALRDVTATVDATPLIAASIMSKKLAIHNDALVIDVKVGNGAFFPTLADGREFARIALEIGKGFGRPVSFVLTAMEQPLGCTVGNALEVREAIATLRGEGPEDLIEVCCVLAAQLLHAARPEVTVGEAHEAARLKLLQGDAIPVFERWVERQGGDPGIAEREDVLPWAPRRISVQSTRTGAIESVNARMVGDLAAHLGAGRARKEDAIDPGAGVVMRIAAGDTVHEGDELAVLHTSQGEDDAPWARMFLDAVTFGERASPLQPAILDVITG